MITYAEGSARVNAIRDALTGADAINETLTGIARGLEDGLTLGDIRPHAARLILNDQAAERHVKDVIAAIRTR